MLDHMIQKKEDQFSFEAMPKEVNDSIEKARANTSPHTQAAKEFGLSCRTLLPCVVWLLLMGSSILYSFPQLFPWDGP